MKATRRETICRIEAGGGHGTGFLLSPATVLTALHVVADRSVDPPRPASSIVVRFRGTTCRGRVVEGLWDRHADWVVLELDRSIEHKPMPLLVLQHGRPQWDAFGFPQANPTGMLVDGDIVDLQSVYQGAPVFQLFSRQAAAGDGMPLPGLSGAPCVVDGGVVGLLRSSLSAEGRNVGGTLYACPIQAVLPRVQGSLPGDPTLDVMVRPAPTPRKPVRASVITFGTMDLTGLSAERALAPGYILADRFALIDCLGRGPHSSVWKANEKKHRLTVALRVLADEPSQNPDAVARFHTAARTSAALRHPNIVRVLLPEAEHFGAHFYVMEFIEGQDLRASTLRATLDGGQVAQAITDAAEALVHAHEQSVFHGQIKPESVLIDSRGRAHVADFDLMWGEDPDVRPGGFGGFLAPEVAAGGPPSAAADVYSLALTALFALSGRNPPKTLTQSPLAALDRLRLRAEAVKVLRAALSTDPAERPSSPRAVAGALQSVAQSLPRRKKKRDVGDSIDGKYTITGTLGQGSNGFVYRAYQHRSEREVALKLLDTAVCERTETVKRFLREGKAVSRLQHPNITTLFECGESPAGEVYMAMEALDGRTLREILSAEGRLATDRAVKLLAQLCDALHHAHSAGLVHRDVHPDNIFVCRASGRLGELLKVLDFGAVKFTSAADMTALTAAGGDSLGARPEYMSPEQISGQDVGPPGDLYAVGIVAYEMLCGRPPFSSSLAVSVLQMHKNEPPPPMSEVCPDHDVPPSVERLVLAALAKDPNDRPRSAGSMAERFAKALEGQTAPPPAPDPAPQAPVTPEAPPAPIVATSPPPPASRVPWIVAAIAGLLAVAAVAWKLFS